MCCLKQEQIIDSFTHDILKIATPSTPIMGMDSKLINSYIKISIKLTNKQLSYFTWKSKKCNVSEENKDLSVDGSEYNALFDFLLFT